MALLIASNAHIYSIEEKLSSKNKPYLIVHVAFYSRSISRNDNIIYDDPFSLRFLVYDKEHITIFRDCQKGDEVFIYGKVANGSYPNKHGEKIYYNAFTLIKAALIAKRHIEKSEDTQAEDRVEMTKTLEGSIEEDNHENIEIEEVQNDDYESSTLPDDDIDTEYNDEENLK